MKYAFLLAAALMVAGLVGSYRAASIGPLVAYMDAMSASTPACRSANVVTSLQRSLDSTGSGRKQAVLGVVRSFQYDPYEQRSHGNRLIEYAQREYWLRAIADSGRLAQAYCAIGIAGKDYNLPSIGAIAGIRDLAHTDPRALQALTDVYVFLHWRAPADKIRQRYRDRLRQIATPTGG